jgi:membrane-associated phospholipid phosphatase
VRGRRRRDLLGLFGGLVVLVASGAIARRGVGRAEDRVFRVVNRLSDRAFGSIWLPMQYGTFGTAPALSALALARRRPRLAVALLASGSLAWVLAKAAKPIVARGRPGTTVEDAVIRGKEEGDQGFPSGHAAVSAALTTVLVPYASEGGGALSRVLAGFVPLARVYVGAHLPLDSMGGSALGLAVGCAVNLGLGVPDRRDRERRR